MVSRQAAPARSVHQGVNPAHLPVVDEYLEGLTAAVDCAHGLQSRSLGERTYRAAPTTSTSERVAMLHRHEALPSQMKLADRTEPHIRDSLADLMPNTGGHAPPVEGATVANQRAGHRDFARSRPGRIVVRGEAACPTSG